jgi:hypothetical protein
MAKARLDSLQQKEKQYRELMIKLTGNTEKRYTLRLIYSNLFLSTIER